MNQNYNLYEFIANEKGLKLELNIGKNTLQEIVSD